jgi:hypothetical protein
VDVGVFFGAVIVHGDVWLMDAEGCRVVSRYDVGVDRYGAWMSRGVEVIELEKSNEQVRSSPLVLAICRL